MPTIKTVSTTVYKFNELSDSAKEKAMNWYRGDDGADFSYHQEYILDDAKAIGKLFGLDIDSYEYSGFWSQGDGLAFDASYRYVKGALAAVVAFAPKDKELHGIVESLQDIQRRNFYRLYAKCTTTRGNNMRVEVEDSEDNYRDLKGYDNQLETELESFAHWIYKNLEREYEYINSDEQVIESIEANEYDFKEDGNIYK